MCRVGFHGVGSWFGLWVGLNYGGQLDGLRLHGEGYSPEDRGRHNNPLCERRERSWAWGNDLERVRGEAVLDRTKSRRANYGDYLHGVLLPVLGDVRFQGADPVEGGVGKGGG